MRARSRTAVMAAVGTIGLSSLAYGVGEVMGGGSAGAAGSSAPSGAATQGGDTQFTATPQTPHHKHPCPHMGNGSGTAAPSQDQAPPAASY